MSAAEAGRKGGEHTEPTPKDLLQGNQDALKWQLRTSKRLRALKRRCIAERAALRCLDETNSMAVLVAENLIDRIAGNTGSCSEEKLATDAAEFTIKQLRTINYRNMQSALDAVPVAMLHAEIHVLAFYLLDDELRKKK